MSIKSVDAKALLKTAGAAIRQLVDENKSLKDKISSDERAVRIVKIARDMEEKGLSNELSFEEKVASLSQHDLDVTEEAVKMATPQGLELLRPGEGPSNGKHAFEIFIETGEAPA